MEKSLSSSINNTNISKRDLKRKAPLEPLDKGHRVGNFHNYYAFHPPSDRMVPLFQDCYPHLPELILRHKEINNNSNFVTYCDLGCNEGVLSLAVARELKKHFIKLNDNSALHIKCLGLDLDDELIRRANCAFVEKASGDEFSNIEALFKVCNLNDGCSHVEESNSFLETIINESIIDTSKGAITRFDLISVFSTTMWIHVHSGDNGLEEFLKRVCKMCKYLLIEPQPSKCYRNMNTRLRKMNRPEIDLSKLRLRPNIETAIEKIIIDQGFHKVPPKSANQNTVIAWNRSLHLYELCENQVNGS